MQLFAKFKKILRSGFRAINFRNFKVALNPLHRIFYLQKVESYHAYHNLIIKNRGHQAHFSVFRAKIKGVI